jgi:hypothetical protein
MPPSTPSRLRASSLAGLKKDGGLTANIAGATALYVVPKSGGASGRRLLDGATAGNGKVQSKNGNAADLEVRTSASASAALADFRRWGSSDS